MRIGARGGPVRRATAFGPEGPEERMRQIDYVHEYNGTLYQGTFSNPGANGRSGVTWVYSVDGREVTRNEPIDVERFEYLWSVIAEHEVFRQCPAQRNFLGADPARCHLVGTYVQRAGDEVQSVYSVPAKVSDPEFRLWLQELNGPWM
jgi:hypothetical protein